MNQPPPHRAILIVVAAAATLAVAPLTTKLLTGPMDPVAIALWRTLLSLPPLLAVLLVLRIRLPHTRHAWISAVIGGVTLVAAPFGALAWGQLHVTSSMGGILYGATPLLVAALAALLLSQERASARDIAGAMIGLFGVLVLIGPNIIAGMTSVGLGQLITLGGPVSYAIGTVLLRRRPKEDALALTAGMYLTGSLVLMAVAPASGVGITPPAPSLLPRLLLLAILGSVVPTVCMYLAIQWAGATRAAFAMLILPLFSLTYGWLFLSEVPNFAMLIGAGLIMTGCAVTLRASQPLAPRDRARG